MSEDVTLWSATASDNDDADSAINFSEGQTPGSVNGSCRSVMATIAKLYKDLGALTTGGSANAYTIASANTAYTVYTNGLLIGFKASFANTGAATLSVNTIGAKAIRTTSSAGGDVALAAGQIQSGGHYLCAYDSAANSSAGAWMLLNPTPDTSLGFQPGMMIDYGGASEPSGWLLCYGQAISRTTYAALFAAVGTAHGAGDGSTTFNLPDCRGRSTFGKDDMGGSAAGRITGSGIVGTTLGASGGAETVTLSTSQIPAHTHTGTVTLGGGHNHGGATGAAGSHSHTATTSSDGAHTHTGSTGNAGGHTPSTSSVTTTLTMAGTATSGGAHTHTATSTVTDPGHTHSVTTMLTHGGLEVISASQQSGSTQNRLLGNSQQGVTSASATTGITVATSTASGGAHTHTVDFTGSSAATTVTMNAVADHAHTISSDGAHTHTLTTSTAADHTHSISTDGTHNHTFTSDSTGGGGAHSNMPPALIVNKIIKT